MCFVTRLWLSSQGKGCQSWLGLCFLVPPLLGRSREVDFALLQSKAQHSVSAEKALNSSTRQAAKDRMGAWSMKINSSFSPLWRKTSKVKTEKKRRQDTQEELYGVCGNLESYWKLVNRITKLKKIVFLQEHNWQGTGLF